MTGKCGKCSKQLPRKQYLTCSLCSISYDIDCAGAEKRFFIMNDEHKRRWKCLPCTQSTSSVINMSTPITENVTFRNKCIINVSTSNSYESLTETLLDDDDDDNSRLNRSCPELSSFKTEDLEELKQKMLSLQLKLDTAEKEIENLVTENAYLTGKLAENELKIKRLKLVCTSSGKSTKKRKKISVSKLSTTTNQCSTEKRKESTGLRHSLATNQSFEGLNIPKTDSKKTESNKDLSGEIKSKKNIIYILGDQQVRGLALKLLESRSGRWNDAYDVISLIKPHARSSDILSSFNMLPNNINKNDIIILSVGSNDTDPYLLFNNVCNTLCKFNNCKVFVTNVKTNRHLNVNRLNNELYMLIRKYDNCTYIDINNKNYENYKSYMQKLTFKINIEIDYIKYKGDFLDVGKKLRAGNNSTDISRCLSNLSCDGGLNIMIDINSDSLDKTLNKQETDTDSPKSPQRTQSNDNSDFFRS